MLSLIRHFVILLLAAALVAKIVSSTAYAGPVTGPVEARLVEITDGDSFKALARIWPGMEIRVTVRLRGVDAPELRGKCAREKVMALYARRRLAELLGSGEMVLVNVSGGKYYGRVLADVRLSDGRDISAVMLTSGLVVSYGGGRHRGWCD